MKTLITLLLVATIAFSNSTNATNIHNGKVIGKIYVNDRFFNQTLKIYCINKVKYMGQISARGSSLSPMYNTNGKIETCR